MNREQKLVIDMRNDAYEGYALLQQMWADFNGLGINKQKGVVYMEKRKP